MSSVDESEGSVEFIRETQIISDGEDDRDISVGLSTIPESELMIGNATSEEEISDDEDIQGPSPQNSAQQQDKMETWEEELEQDVSNCPAEIKDWATLWTQVKADLKKGAKTWKLALSKVNKLMIICNFATLRLKGKSHMEASLEIAEQWHERDGVWFSWKVRALARHYQVFEQLPVEHCGGLRNAHSLLKNELVKKRILDYLQSLPTGKVMPKKLQVAVNTEILLDLGITPKKPVGTCTARHRLIKLGWRYTEVKKGCLYGWA